MDQTRYMLLKAHNPKQLTEELALETILKAAIPGVQLDHLSYADKKELCFVTKANKAFLNRTPVDIQKSLSVNQQDMKKALSQWLPELNQDKLTDNQLAVHYVLQLAKQGRQ